jgi:hypothetical protein
MTTDNPFTLSYDPNHFCDREAELKLLNYNKKNGLNTLLHSPRRLGKSALIKYFFYQVEAEKSDETIYVDLFATKNMADLIRILARKVLDKYHKKNILEGVKTLLKNLSPSISFNQDGTPKLNLEIHENQYETSLEQIFNYLEKQSKKVLIAFDEFQETAVYPEKAEAILRTHIQDLRNVRFIYSGSTSHLLQEMFLSAKRPFYQSAEVIVLQKIEREKYRDFICRIFEQYGKSLETDAVEFMLDFSETYTYYTQLTCNQCFAQADQILTRNQAGEVMDGYLESRKFDYLNILNMMTENQRRLVTAISKEGNVEKPTSVDFLIKYKLPPASSVLQSLNVLLDREILYKSLDGVVVYDVFFKQFIRKYF